MPHAIRSRLSIMMFIQYTGMGVFLPTMGFYLNGYLAFDPYRVGLVLSMPAVATFVSPLLVAAVADRWISSERLLASLHFLACGSLVLVWKQTEFWPFLLAYLLFWLVFSPTLAMTNTVAFHHLGDARRDFGPVRVWGTIGWVMVGFLFGLLWLRYGGIGRESSRLPHAFIFAAATSAVMGMYALTLPVTERAAGHSERASPWKGMGVFGKRSMLILCAITLANTILNMFYINWMSPYLNQLGFAEGWILPILSVGQISEILVIGGLGYVIGWAGLKGALLIGLCTQALRFIIFAVGPGTPLLIAAIGLHGLSYGCFFIVAMIYVDNHCTRHNRASAQLLLNTVIGGFGNLTGSLAAGAVAQSMTIAGTRLIDYQRFWFVPAAICTALTIAFLAFFREEPAAPVKPESH